MKLLICDRREYGISVADIDANPILVSEPLKVGQQLVISVKEQQLDKPTVVTSVTVAVVATIPASEVKKSANVQQPLGLLLKTQLLHNLKQTLYVRYFPKETKYGIAKYASL
jgi:hypothetical protein